MTTLVERTRKKLGPIGTWGPHARIAVPADVERRELARIDRLGYGSSWTAETVGGKESFARHGLRLAATERLTVGTGIANVWARNPATMQAGGRTLAEAYPGRFILGIGIGSPWQAEKAGEVFHKPLRYMENYLLKMDEEAAAKPPPEPFPRVLATIGPKMLGLARDRADGAHPYFMPVEHTAFAREILGPDKLLVPHQLVLLEADARRARACARETALGASAIPHYAAGWARFGYADDLAGRTDRFIDAAVAWGDEEAILQRVRDHLDAGADHVLVSPIGDTLPSIVDQLEKLAPALLGVAA